MVNTTLNDIQNIKPKLEGVPQRSGTGYSLNYPQRELAPQREKSDNACRFSKINAFKNIHNSSPPALGTTSKLLKLSLLVQYKRHKRVKHLIRYLFIPTSCMPLC